MCLSPGLIFRIKNVKLAVDTCKLFNLKCFHISIEQYQDFKSFIFLDLSTKNKIVYRKRQNLYYVKVQERLSTLDAEDDYIMTVTSICGPATVNH